MENILELENISKSFPKSNFLLDKLSFSLPYGTILGFVGENGAGKTTTLRVLSTLIKPDSGDVKVEFAHFSSPDDKAPAMIYRINTAR